ncbi:NAD(P)-binding protein [Durotheca rogersii]|uniref:NAD(P)-binding protein n=1 Tax=Durotheca rogersii TaxID=419775 RepID=UPI0022209E62|nr:NAD(P)-binding protein [Durotheca rogersii]KAI5864078.1 NAD(P)-binding protein [Durotheca rogersii]
MADQRLVVVISGAGRGIGNALAQAYLSRPNCTVVGGIRDENSPGVAELKASPPGAGSELLLVKLESTSPTDAKSAVEKMTAAGVDHIDVLIANAGVSPPIKPLETVTREEVANVFDINALGTLSLYQACHSLLEKSKNAKFASISSAAGSIGAMESNGAYVAPAYAISKSAMNWITLSAHCSNKWLTTIAINPGLVATDMGNWSAKFLGLEKAPYTKEYSAERVISIIDAASRENSGRFWDAIEGKELPW